MNNETISDWVENNTKDNLDFEEGPVFDVTYDDKTEWFSLNIDELVSIMEAFPETEFVVKLNTPRIGAK